jgi:hypothetical protein
VVGVGVDDGRVVAGSVGFGLPQPANRIRAIIAPAIILQRVDRIRRLIFALWIDVFSSPTAATLILGQLSGYASS